KRPQAKIIVDGERPIRIGHTSILIATILGLEVLMLWANETAEVKASYYMLPLLATGLPVAAWVAVWVVLSRLFSGIARFGRNLLIALSILLALSLYNEFALFAAFALTWRIPADYGYVALWCALAAAAFLHWREIGPSRLGRKGALVMLVLALAIGAQTLTRSEAFDDTGRQVTSRRLLPPWLRVVPI